MSIIIAAKRTPIGRMLGSLHSIPAPQLAATALRAAAEHAGMSPGLIEEVILGNVLPAGIGQAPARQAALAACVPATAAALTINKVCGSGLKAVMLADQAVRCGDARLIAAGGMENMSQAPHLLMNARSGWKFGPQTALDSMQHDGLRCATEDVAMGDFAENVAREYKISREDQDAFAAESHRRAIAAIEAGAFSEEIAPVTIESRKGSIVVDADEGPRSDTTAEALARLRGAFSKDGTVTAGNASQISDGAAVVLVADEATAANCTNAVQARIVSTAVSGGEPRDLFIAPVAAIRLALEKANLKVEDLDSIELNEAFASQMLACVRALNLPPEKTNPRGGGIALGHPIGASGARVLVTLLHTLTQTNGKFGIAALCLGGGNAVAMVVERISP